MAPDFVLTLGNNSNAGEIVLGEGCQALPHLVGSGVTKRHARVFQRDGRWWIQDLGSAAGTLLNGVELYGAKPLADGDSVSLSGVRIAIILRGHRPGEASHHDDGCDSEIVLEVDGLSVADPDKPTELLIEDMSFRVRRGEFVGVIGPSGCGKSTLLKAIVGLRHWKAGVCRVAVDVQRDAIGCGIGYLPQDLVIHERLRVADALQYVSAIRNEAGDFSPDRVRVNRLIDDLDLRKVALNPIHTLSGGEKKRLGFAAERLGDSAILLLDEPTSGLDPSAEAGQMKQYRSLAEDHGKTILCVTHSNASLAQCHRVLSLERRRIVFDGPPTGLAAAKAAADLEQSHGGQPRLEPTPSRNVSGHPLPPASARSGSRLTPIGRGERNFSWSALGLQSWRLVCRAVQLVAADWRNMCLVVGQSPAIALLVVATFGVVKVDFAELHAARLKELFLIQALAVLWCSGTASVREIVKEWPLLRHEHRYGVLPGSVFVSKFVVLAATAMIQAVLLTVITKAGCQVVGSWGSQLTVLCLLGCVGVLQGLCISAIAGTTERAMTILPVVLIGEAIVSGGFAHLTGFIRVLAQVVNPAYWALDGLRSSLSTELLIATYAGAPGTFQPPILGQSGPLLLDLTMLAVQGIGFFSVAYIGFRTGLMPARGPRAWRWRDEVRKLLWAMPSQTEAA